MEGKMKKFNLIFVTFLLVFALILNGCSVQNTEKDKNTITVTGIGKSEILPDEARVYMSIETSGKTAEESEQENSRISDRVRAELFLEGISASEVQTSNFNVYPEYDYTDGKNKIIGYKTTNSLIVKTTQFSKIGKIIDAGIRGGVNRVDSIQFELSEEKQSEAKKDALEKASRDAREKAEAIASGLNVKIGKIRSVTSQDYYYEPRLFYSAVEGAGFDEAVKAASTVIVPGELETSAQVQVTFEIK